MVRVLFEIKHFEIKFAPSTSISLFSKFRTRREGDLFLKILKLNWQLNSQFCSLKMRRQEYLAELYFVKEKITEFSEKKFLRKKTPRFSSVRAVLEIKDFEIDFAPKSPI